MSWLKMDDKFGDHPKVLELSDAAFRLHVRAMCFAARQETDGFLSKNSQKTLGAKPKNIQELERAGLWESSVDGHWIHDFLDYNPSREKLTAERESTRIRVERHRRNAVTLTTEQPPKPEPVTVLQTRSPGEGVTGAPSRPVPTPDQIQPDTSNQRPVRLVQSEPPPPPTPPLDLTDSERMTLCPPDLHERARKLGVIAELAAALRADPDSLFAEAEDYVQHQVISEQKPGNRWMTRLRSQLRRKAKAGLLPAPGAIEHAKVKAESPLPKGWRPQPGAPGYFIDERGFSHPDPRKAS